MRWYSFVLVIVLAAAAGPRVWAQSQPQEQEQQRQSLIRTPSPAFRELSAGLPQVARYCGDDAFSLDRLARDVAPVMWPSTREQFLPERLPRVQQAAPPVTRMPERAIYYRVRHLHFLASRPRPFTDLTADWARGDQALQNRAGAELMRPWPQSELGLLYRVDLRYFFYYWSETGAGAHVNDLESAELKLLLGRDTQNCTFVSLWEMFGSAHGLSLSTNSADLSRASGWERDELMPAWVLHLQPGCDDVLKALAQPATAAPSLPAVVQFTNKCFYKPVFFIEEGKHASGTNVNEDTTLTPVIDLNSSHLDAWGVKDALGTDSRVSHSFKGELFVPRVERDMVIPRLDDGGTLRHPGDNQPAWAAARIAQVLPARLEPFCTNQAAFDTLTHIWSNDPAPGRRPGILPPEPDDLLAEKEFCLSTAIRIQQSLPGRPKLRGNLYLLRDVGNPYQNKHYLEGVDLAFRLDGGFGWTWVPPVAVSPPFIGGWFAAKINGNFPETPVDKEIPKAIDVLYMGSATRSVGWYAAGGREWNGDYSWDTSRFAWELGFKVRMPPRNGFYPAVRIGYRFNGTRAITNQRFLIEFGTGVW